MEVQGVQPETECVPEFEICVEIPINKYSIFTIQLLKLVVEH
jgi:hypothetical protein